VAQKQSTVRKPRLPRFIVKKFIILLDGVAHSNAKGTSVQYPIHPSNCVITELDMTANRARILERKAAGKKVSAAKKVAA